MLVKQAINAGGENSSTKVIWRMVRWSNASERDKHVYLFIFIKVF